MPASFSTDEKRSAVPAVLEGGTVQAHTRTGPFIGKSLRFFGGLVGPLDKRKARRLRGPGSPSIASTFFKGHGLNLSSPCPCVFPYGEALNFDGSQPTKIAARKASPNSQVFERRSK